MARVFVGLGANLGDREANLETAAALIEADPDITLLKKSGIIETDPVDYLDQPRFLNQIVLINTALPPQELLSRLLAIEADMGRVRDIPKGPRRIDLDILLYDTLIIDTERLVIPHPGIPKREFLLAHLIELEPALRDPLSGEAYSRMLARLRRC